MKGTIVRCLEEVVRDNFSDEQWEEILVKAGHEADREFTSSEDVPDADAVKMIGITAEVLGISADAAMEAFGMHWSTSYAPSIYDSYFQKASNAREFLLSLDAIHVTITSTMENARPPRFTYDESDPTKLVMNYDSSRGLVALMPGLAKGIGKYYGEEVEVSLEGNAVNIEFKAEQYRKAS
ncbi:MAG: heme NO-binding domain-containing protein [Myxococcota bacterium]